MEQESSHVKIGEVATQAEREIICTPRGNRSERGSCTHKIYDPPLVPEQTRICSRPPARSPPVATSQAEALLRQRT